LIVYSSNFFQSLHDDIVRSLLFAPISYFENMPFDKIISRISTELSNNDKAFTAEIILAQNYVQDIIGFFACILFIYFAQKQYIFFAFVILQFLLTFYFYQKYFYLDQSSNRL